MRSDSSGNGACADGTVGVTSLVVTAVGQFTTVGAADAQSHFTPDGTITIVVPNAALGSPRAGDILGGVVGRTYLLAGSAVTSGRVAIDVTDALAPPYVLVGNSYCVPPVVSCLEDDDPHIAYSNGWHKVNDPDASAGHFRVKVGSGTVTLSFDVAAGKFGAVTYNYAKSPKGGLANVSLNGVPQGTISYQGSSGTTNAPQFGFSTRYGCVRPGSHPLPIPAQTGPAYVDSFCLESSSSNAPPSSG